MTLHNARKSLAKKRANEAKLENTKQFLEDQHSIQGILDWENRSNTLSLRNHLKLQDKTQIEKATKFIEERKNQLKALYGQEMSEWRTIIAESQHETIEQRMEKIREKAYRLKEQRELDRKHFVSNCYYRQWRDASDDARIIESKARLKQVMHDRELIKSMKIEDCKNASPEQPYLTSLPLWADEDADNRDRVEKNTDFRQALDFQVTFNKDVKHQQHESQSEEEKQLLQQWKAVSNEAKQRERERIIAAKCSGLETLKENEKDSQAIAKKRKEERERDLILLNYALKKENDEVNREINKKKRAQEETRMYTKFLQEQMIRESIDTGEFDSIMAKEAERISAARDAKIKAQDDARNRLLREVQEGRVIQIEEKGKIREQEEKAELEELASRMKDIRKDDERERSRKEMKRLQILQDTEYIKKQIDHKESVSNLNKQNKYLQSKLMNYAEKRQRHKLSNITFS